MSVLSVNMGFGQSELLKSAHPPKSFRPLFYEFELLDFKRNFYANDEIGADLERYYSCFVQRALLKK